MKKNVYLLILLFFSILSNSQVGIGTNTPSSKSILDLTATDKGFLLPRMTSAQRVAIAPNNTTDIGMQVYDTDTLSIWYWNGTTWIQQGAKNIYDSDGDISPTAPVNRFVDASFGGSLNFYYSLLYMDFDEYRVGIGNPSPEQLLDVNGPTLSSLYQSRIQNINVSTQASGSALLGLFANNSIINFTGTTSGNFFVPQFYNDILGRIVYVYNFTNNNITFTNGGYGAPYTPTHIYGPGGADVVLALGEGMMMINNSGSTATGGQKWFASKL